MTPYVQFSATCPKCQRTRQLSISYLGRPVRCRSCAGAFVAIPPDQNSAAERDPIHYTLNYCADVDRYSAAAGHKPR